MVLSIFSRFSSISNNFSAWLIDLLFTVPVILISLSVHELAHGYVAYKLGDNTAKSMGRLTLNPLHHIDPFGFISMILLGFGWAKPVMIDARYFKKPKRDTAFVSLAGPVSNFILAFLFVLIYTVFFKLTGYHLSSFEKAVNTLLAYFILINVGLGVFNLIPIPPLDGSKVLYAFLPYRIIFKIRPYERYIQLILIFLLFVGLLSEPISTAVDYIITFMAFLADKILFFI